MIPKKKRMYQERKANIGAFVGCPYNCIYCAFRKAMARFGRDDKCRNFQPHAHLERLDKQPPKTGLDEFITIGLSSDISHATDEVIGRIADFCCKWEDRDFLLQSKNPARFLDFDFPDNVLLGTTIETNYTNILGAYGDPASTVPYRNISAAPPPEERLKAMTAIRKNKKIVTIEPILEFDPYILKDWMRLISPSVVYIGYDSGRNLLPEPPLAKTEDLIELLEPTAEIRQKLLRPAWWEI